MPFLGLTGVFLVLPRKLRNPTFVSTTTNCNTTIEGRVVHHRSDESSKSQDIYNSNYRKVLNSLSKGIEKAVNEVAHKFDKNLHLIQNDSSKSTLSDFLSSSCDSLITFTDLRIS